MLAGSREPRPSIALASRFPPPYDGQAVAAQRLFELLSPSMSVVCLPLDYTRGELLAPRSPLSRVALLVDSMGALRERLRELRAALVVYNAVSGTLAGHLRDMFFLFRCVRSDHRVVAVVHNGNYSELFSSPLTRPSARLFARRIAGFVCLTPTLANKLRPWVDEEKIAVVPNTVTGGLLCSPPEVDAARDVRVRNHTLRLVFMSNMYPEKGYFDLLEAVKRLLAEGVDAFVTFVGGWPDERKRRRFFTCLTALQLEDSVRHHGSVSDTSVVKELLLESHALVLPTYYPFEAQPMTIIEALNAGTPVVATAFAGIPDVVHDGVNGLLVKKKDPSDLADKLKELRSKSLWTRLSRGARQTFDKHYHPERVRVLWMDYLSRVISTT